MKLKQCMFDLLLTLHYLTSVFNVPLLFF
uniref:Uncharacterized protein n=1 Tax=Arundo donax TaxID=35708 RepID=A0A0A9CA66_ARUDO